MEAFAAYNHALASLGGFALLMIVLGMVSTVGRTAENRCACGQVKRNYEDVAYRRGRAFMNAIEATGPFIAALLGAMFVGASPFWVNLFASVFLLGRIATAVVHIGTTNEPLRSATWMVGLICTICLAVMTISGAVL